MEGDPSRTKITFSPQRFRRSGLSPGRFTTSGVPVPKGCTGLIVPVTGQFGLS